MVDKTSYRVSTKRATYKPTDQSNIEKAVREAVEISQIEQKPVELYFGEHMFLIDAAPSTSKLVRDYLNAIDYRYNLAKYIGKLKEASK